MLFIKKYIKFFNTPPNVNLLFFNLAKDLLNIINNTKYALII